MKLVERAMCAECQDVIEPGEEVAPVPFSISRYIQMDDYVHVACFPAWEKRQEDDDSWS